RLLCSAYAFSAVVISRESQWPGAEEAVVIGEQLCCSLGRAEWVQTVIDRVIDPHVATTGGPHELPQAGRTNLRIGCRVKGRLHVGQHSQLGWQAQVCERLCDVSFPCA